MSFLMDLASIGAATIPTVDFSGAGIGDIATAIASNIPSVLAAVVPILGVRKVISFCIGMIRGA